MKKTTLPISTAVLIAASLTTACVSPKIHQYSLQRNQLLEAQISRSGTEISGLREENQLLKEELRAKNDELLRLKTDLTQNLRTIEECNDRVKALSVELNQLKTSIENQNNTTLAMISSYEGRLKNLQDELILAKKKKATRRKINQVGQNVGKVLAKK
jgi:chromosome segregation ATPase